MNLKNSHKTKRPRTHSPKVILVPTVGMTYSDMLITLVPYLSTFVSGHCAYMRPLKQYLTGEMYWTHSRASCGHLPLIDSKLIM